MKKNNKKKISGISGIIAALFIAPLIVFAAVYFSNERKNSFEPGSVDIEVNEGDETSRILENDNFEWSKKLETPDDNDESNDIYYTDKSVKIKDTRKNNGEVLRVSFIPMWYDMNEQKEQTDVLSDVFNFNNINITQSESGDTLTYCDHNESDGDNHDNDKIITLKLTSGWNTNGWRYVSDDGCFYYNGSLYSGNLTAQLLDSVELNAKAYELTENYVFRLDVLADAIQSSGDAYATREWNPPREWNTP